MLALDQLAIRRGPYLLFEQASLQLARGQKLGLTGANGCGKSSLLDLVLGRLQADAGDYRISPDWVVAHVAQEVEATDRSAIDHVIDGDLELRRVMDDLAVAEQTGDGDVIAHCHVRLDEIGGYQARSRAARLLAGLSFTDTDLERPMSAFSGGWRMRLNLARALMSRSDLLLLDEPTNHLDLDAVIWLENWLRQYPGALILISHDRDFLDAIVDQIAHIEQKTLTLYRGNYSQFEVLRAEKLAQTQSQYQKQQQSIRHMQQFVERFRAKATKAKQAQSRIKALERMALIAPAHVDTPFHFAFREPEVLPQHLMKLASVAVGYGDQIILQGVNLTLLAGARIGLLGLNGAGKSTLIKLIAGEIEACEGAAETARDLKIGYFAQHQLEQLDPQASPLLHLQRIDPLASDRELRAFLGGFNFSGDRVLEPVAPFSGGEKARLVLALLIWQKPNLLLLDEPTNHLDLEMRLALNQALQEFGGSVILVSHDRHLLRSVCDELLLVDRGQVEDFARPIEDYPAWLTERRAGRERQPTTKAGPGEGQRRKLDADFRKSVQPQKSRLKRIERSMEKIQQSQTETEQALADPALYDEARKERLRELVHVQADNRQQLQLLEQEWLEISEEIEGLEQVYYQSANAG
jgi:ATP-binding cassette subfamily F protein 3